jgi:CcmD family protein
MKKVFIAAAGLVALLFVLIVPDHAAAQAQAQPQAQPQKPPAAQSEYVPADQLPATQEQLPAAPLVIAAYAIVWLALLLYLWSIWRRLQKVDRELADVKAQIAARTARRG